MAAALLHEDIWFDRLSVEDAEYKFYEHIANKHAGLSVQTSSSLVNEIARARENIQSSLSTGVGLKVGVSTDGPAIFARLNALEKENENLKKVTSDLQVLVTQLQARVTALEGGKPTTSLPKAPTPPQEQGEDEVDEDSDSSDDEDLFGDNADRRKEAADLKQKMKDAEAAKKKKKEVIAKSSIILDVKPLGDDTDMDLVKEKVTSIVQDGLVWGQSRLLPVAYGIKKLQITCVVEDDKVSVDDLETKISEFDELVQSVDVVAFNKI